MSFTEKIPLQKSLNEVGLESWGCFAGTIINNSALELNAGKLIERKDAISPSERKMMMRYRISSMTFLVSEILLVLTLRI